MLLHRLVGDDVDRDVRAGVGRVASDERRRYRDRGAVQIARELLRRGGFHGLEEIKGRRKDLVLDVDLSHGGIGDVLALRGDDGDRRADFEHFLVEEEACWIGGTEEDVRVLGGEVPAMDDLPHTRKLLGL